MKFLTMNGNKYRYVEAIEKCLEEEGIYSKDVDIVAEPFAGTASFSFKYANDKTFIALNDVVPLNVTMFYEMSLFVGDPEDYKEEEAIFEEFMTSNAVKNICEQLTEDIYTSDDYFALREVMSRLNNLVNRSRRHIFPPKVLAAYFSHMSDKEIKSKFSSERVWDNISNSFILGNLLFSRFMFGSVYRTNKNFEFNVPCRYKEGEVRPIVTKSYFQSNRDEFLKNWYDTSKCMIGINGFSLFFESIPQHVPKPIENEGQGLFFIDAPYLKDVKCDSKMSYHANEFTLEGYQQIAECCDKVREEYGDAYKFCLTHHAHPEVEKIFGNKGAVYTIDKKGGIRSSLSETKRVQSTKQEKVYIW